MKARYASIWFPYLLTDYTIRKDQELAGTAFVLTAPDHGRMKVVAASVEATRKGIHTGMVLADCKAIFPELKALESQPGREVKVLRALAGWSIGYTPAAAVDLPDGLILDISGCAHLWGGEERYLSDILCRLTHYGYTVRGAIADTAGIAWGRARFASEDFIVKEGIGKTAISSLPAAALRLETTVLSRLGKLGFRNIGSFIDMPPSVLRRRFGASLPRRIAQVLGFEIEAFDPVRPVEPYQERLPSMEPVRLAAGIEVALKELLESLCVRLDREGLGLRTGIFKAYRVDGNVQQIRIGTGQASRNAAHLFKLFALRIQTLKPDLGFELFVLEALKVEEVSVEQAAIWETSAGSDARVAELIDRLVSRMSPDSVSRYLPQQRHWPERSYCRASALKEKRVSEWRTDLPRPVHLLQKPEKIEVSAPVPDYPPMLFRYKGALHKVSRSDGPERIEQEWWMEEALFRDYYCLEDEAGARFWVFRSGSYDREKPEWFLHGFFA